MRTWLPQLHSYPLLFYQVLSFLGNVSSVHENMMLPNLDTFVLLAIEGLARIRRMNIGAWSSTEKVRANRTRTEVQVKIFGL